jgi:hypothetical protein
MPVHCDLQDFHDYRLERLTPIALEPIAAQPRPIGAQSRARPLGEVETPT